MLHDAVAGVVTHTAWQLKKECAFLDAPKHLFPEVLEVLDLVHRGMVSANVRSCRSASVDGALLVADPSECRFGIS